MSNILFQIFKKKFGIFHLAFCAFVIPGEKDVLVKGYDPLLYSEATLMMLFAQSGFPAAWMWV